MTSEAYELTLYACNTSQLYAQFKCIIANYKRKMNKGQYNPIKAAKGWEYWYQSAAKLYCKEFGCTKSLVFPISVIRECASATERGEYEKLISGEYK